MSVPLNVRGSRQQCAFTLTELLVVMVIIVAMAALIGPAVNSFGRANALTGAGNTVVNMASLARQQAIAKNTMTALVLLGRQDTDSDFRAITVAEFQINQDPVETGTAVAGFWKQVTKWEFFPPGVVADFDDLESSTFIKHSPQLLPFTSSGQEPLAFRGKGLSTRHGTPAYSFRVFLPSGSLQNPGFKSTLRLVEGFREGDKLIYTRQGEKKSGDDRQMAANFYDVTLVGTTGLARVTRPGDSSTDEAEE